MSIRLEVWGDNALFTRGEFKTERVTYDVMTPSAARGILEAIFWHPGMCWRIDRIHVLNPIRFDSIRRNEVDSVIDKGKIRAMAEGRGDGGTIYAAESIQQRASTILRDVRYVIDAHFELTTALNTLLADESRVQRIGNDTVISWACCGNAVYSDLFGDGRLH